MRTTRVPLLSACVLACLAGRSHAQVWTQTGGPGAGIVQSFASANGSLFAGTQGAIYKSTNAGLNWINSSGNLPSGAVVGTMAATSSHIFAGTQSNKLWRSSDGGQSWTSTSVGLPQPGIVQIVARGQILFLINGQNGLPGNVGSLFTSTDQGDSWAPIATPSLLFTIFPEQDFLFASTVNGVIRADSAGASWSTFNSGLPINGLVKHFVRVNGALLVDISNTVYRSVNNGQTWTPSGAGLPSNTTTYDIIPFGNDVFLAAQTYPTFSVFRSTDNGLSWQHADSGLPPGIERLPRALGSIGQTLVIGMAGGAARTENSGQTWTDANSGMLTSRINTLSAFGSSMWATIENSTRVFKYDGSWTASATGLPTTSLRMLGLLAADASTLYAGTSNSGVFKSVDGGQSWNAVNTNLPQYIGTAGEQYREIAHLAADGTTIYAGTGFGTEFFNQAFRTSGGGMVRTTNGGASWQTVNAGFPIIAFNQFNEPVFDPVTGVAVIDGTVFVGTSTRGVIRLTPGAGVWIAANTGLAQCSGSFPSMAGFVKRGSEIFAVSGGFGCFCSCTAGPSVWKSADGGVSWTASAAGLPELAGSSIKLVGKDLVVGLRVGAGNPSPTVFKSINGGASWSPLGTGLEGRVVSQLAVLGSTIHAGTEGSGDWVLSSPCYPNCDQSTSPPMLNANDFQCFLNSFAGGSPYANCDGSTGNPSLTTNDFQCFLNAFAVGCP